MTPVLKWAGGKRRLLNHILPLIPRDAEIYCEPFVGGGAVWLSLEPSKAVISDANSDLILTYRVIRDHLDELLNALSECRNEPTFYYSMRNWDRDTVRYLCRSDIDRACRMLYLNRTCYNGLYRENKRGEFNVPFGHYIAPDIVQEDKLRALSDYLNRSDIQLVSQDFCKTLVSLEPGAFVYLDPPYDPISETANFTGYTLNGFDHSEQLRLKQICDILTDRGVKWLMSNSATPFIRGLYLDYVCEEVTGKRTIAADSSARKDVRELLVRNYS